MHTLSAFLSLTVLIAICPSHLHGQFAQSSQFIPRPATLDATGIVFSRDVNEVNLDFTVTDKRGRFVTNLGPADFEVLDNLLPPQSMRYFQRQSDLPIRVALVIDSSDSTRYRFKYEQKAATTFLKKILRPGKDVAMVLGFNGGMTHFHDFTGDMQRLSSAIKSIIPGGDTALYDAVVFACNRLREGRENTRRAIILITDGMDTASQSALYDAQRAAERAQATLFAFNTSDSGFNPEPEGDPILRLLSESTGGRLLRARDEDQMMLSFQVVEETLRNQYSMSYEPAEFKPDGSFRRIIVSTLKKGLKVQCRQGYVAKTLEAVKMDGRR